MANDKGDLGKDRRDRLADALRDNLKRRKTQARTRREQAADAACERETADRADETSAGEPASKIRST